MRFFIADSALVGNLGHHANAAKYVFDSVRRRGVDVLTFGHKNVEPSLRKTLNAVPHFRAYTYAPTDQDPYCGWLTSFHDVTKITLDDLNAIKDVRQEDIFFFHAAQAAQLTAMIQWAAAMSVDRCPMIVIELGGDPGVIIARDGSGKTTIPNPQDDPRATLFRFAGQQMQTLEGRPFHVITYDATISQLYQNLMMRPIGVLPFPTPAILPIRNRAGASPITVSVLGHQQIMKGYHLMPEIAKQVLKREKNVRFHIHNSDDAHRLSVGSLAMKEAAFQLSRIAEKEPRITLDERAVEFEEWKQLLEQTDLMLCPYDPHRYATGHSGLASSAIANGIPIVVPDKTSLSNWVDEFGQPGVKFDDFEPKSIIAAVCRAVREYDSIASRAVGAADQWSRTHGPDNCVAKMFELNQLRLGRSALPADARETARERVSKEPPPAATPAKEPRRDTQAERRLATATKEGGDGKAAPLNNFAGIAYAAKGDFNSALQEFETAISKLPTFAEAWFCRAKTLEELGNAAVAYDSYTQAVMHAPLYREADERIRALGTSLGRATAILTPWLIDPKPGLAAHTLHKMARLAGKREDVRYSYRDRDEGTLRLRLLQNPGSCDDAVALGRVLMGQGRIFEAELFFRYALRLEPWNGEAAVRLCSALETEAPKVPQIKPVVLEALAAGATDDRLPSCALWADLSLGRWQDFDDLHEKTMAAFTRTPSAVSPLTMLYLTSDRRKHQACAAAFFKEVTRKSTQRAKKDAPPRKITASASAGKLTVGYLSADFRNHAVAYLFAELFELHDRKKIRSVGLGTFNGDVAEIGRRIRGSFDEFVDLSDVRRETAVQKIIDSKVDILVDLTGHTANPQTNILAAKPAPILVNFLGYPGTLGTDLVDYVIADKIVAPSEHQDSFSEAIVHMSGCYQVNDRKRPRGSTRLTRSQAGLPENAMVFCCFNETRKILPATFQVWMRILKRVPDSVLWLYVSNPLAADNLRREATSAGVEPSRLVFAGKIKLEEHLSRYRLAELFLDTHPYGAHTTGSDALWVGCPVLTLRGDAFAGRVGASLLTAAGLPELITESWQEYEDLAVRLGNDTVARIDLRRKLGQVGPSSRLFDSPRFTRQLEWAYGEMRRRHVNGEKPQSFAVPDL